MCEDMCKDLFNSQTRLISEPSPLAHSKAVKNPVEIEGMRLAHVSSLFGVSLTSASLFLSSQNPGTEAGGRAGCFQQ